MSCIYHSTNVQRTSVGILISLNDIEDQKYGQVRTVTKSKEAQNRMKDPLASH